MASSAKVKTKLYQKYATRTSHSNWKELTRLKPSDMFNLSVEAIAEEYPKIIEYHDIQDNSLYVRSSVDTNQPLFQPSPKAIVFEDYAPYASHEKRVYFRNNDSVARRIKVHQPESPFFEVSAPKNAQGEPVKQSKIAAGMEVCYLIRFKPQEVMDHFVDLVCTTERETFMIPIRAFGLKPNLTFPDEIEFDSCPVKSSLRKRLLIQNTGSVAANFYLRSASVSFTCPDDAIVIETGASRMIEFFFTPQQAALIEGEIELEYVNGPRCFIRAFGTGTNIDVSLSAPSLTMNPSYISLATKKTIRIKNASDMPVEYVWKSFSKRDEEEAERARLLAEINRMEEIEESCFVDRLSRNVYAIDLSDDDELSSLRDDTYDFSEQMVEGRELLQTFKQYEGHRSSAARSERAALMRKYRNLRTALAKDSMSFVDDIFDISPVRGTVWARSELAVTITFKPDTAAKYACTAYLDVSGQEERIPLNLFGVGIGPTASLSFDVLDVGDVFISEEQEYEVSIINKGDIAGQWSFLAPLSRFGSKFEFSPHQGLLPAGGEQVIKIKFESDLLGEFSEFFRFALQGNDELLVCQIKGHVIGPTFHFDVNKIDFGVVSFDYLHTANLRLVNTSKIPMAYTLRVPQDGVSVKKDFDVDPRYGVLNSGGHVDVTVDFIPSTLKMYDYSLVVDVAGVGEKFLCLPISADCQVSTLQILTKTLAFGDCFLRYPYTQDVVLFNSSDTLRAKIEILPQLEYSRHLATYVSEPSIAVIEPGQTLAVKVRLVAAKLNRFNLPVMISIAGSPDPPLQVTIQGTGVGPKIVTSASELRWGNTQCLYDSPRVLTITNAGLITGRITIFLKMARSKFALSVEALTLEPSQSHELTITANLDDSIVYNDEVHILVEEGDNLMVPVSARGVGATMYCSEDLNCLDLGVQLTNHRFEKKIVLENKGRRQQVIRWTNITAKEENEIRAAKAKKVGKDAGGRLPKSLQPIEPIFSVTPDEITLRPRTATTFTFRGFCSSPSKQKEIFLLETRIGKERKSKSLFRTEVICTFVDPLITFSVPHLDFLYTWSRGDADPLPHQQQVITLQNTSVISLSFTLQTEVPFNLSFFESALSPGSSVDVTVDFDPMFLYDRLTRSIEKQLQIGYKGHAQKDSIILTADINFPNLAFDAQSITFGSVLNETYKTIKLLATNTSKVPVSYEWSFYEEEKVSTGLQKMKKKSKTVELSVGQIFDVLPVRAVILPGTSEFMEFTMFGASNGKASGLAKCAVEGGPEYSFPISGEASFVSFILDRAMIDFGLVLYTDRKDEELTIINDGRVPFAYEVFFESSRVAEIIEVVPATGKVLPGDKLKLIVRVRPAYPETVVEKIFVRVAHFDPVPVTCYCRGIFPAPIPLLPRYHRIGPFGETDRSFRDAWDAFHAEAAKNCRNYMSDVDTILLSTQQVSLGATSAMAPAFVSIDDNAEPEDMLFVQSPVGGSRANSKAKVNQRAIEVEMQRMSFNHLLRESVDSIDKDARKADGNVPAQALIAKFVDIKAIVIATYICDFGNVIIGSLKRKVFQIANASNTGPLSWSFDKKCLTFGFAIEPAQVSKLPEGGVVDFEVVCSAKSPNDSKLGRRTCSLSLLCKDGAMIMIILSANICVPDVVVSSDEIDFGQVMIGCAKQICFQLHNTSPITATWHLPQSKGKNDSFRITPSEGSLRAGKKVTLNIEFVPTDTRNYVSSPVIKIDSNNKPKNLKLVGEGVEVPLRFEPSSLDMGAVLPFTAGSRKTVNVFNDTDTSVELYSVDFDTVFVAEDEMLSLIDIYDDRGLFRCAPRLAGDPFPRELTTAYNTLKSSDQGDRDSADRGDAAVPPAVKLRLAPVRIEPAPRDGNLHQDFLVVGPPLSGVTTIANALSNKLRIPLRTIDQVLDDIAGVEGDLGFLARRALNRMTDTEAAATNERLEYLRATAEESKSRAASANAATKKGAAKKTAKAVAESALPHEEVVTPEMMEYNTFLQAAALSTVNLTKLLNHRLTWPDAGYGIVIDGLTSSVVDAAVVLESIAQAMPRGVVCRVHIGSTSASVEDSNSALPENQAIPSVYLNRIKSLYYQHQAAIPPLERAIQNGIEAIGSIKKSLLKDIAVDGAAADALIGDDSVEVCLPTGFESWIKPDTGALLELDPLEFKTLDVKNKLLYTKQHLYHNTEAKRRSQNVLLRIAASWSPDVGLLTPTPAALGDGGPAESNEPFMIRHPSPVMDYMTRISSLIDAVFPVDTENEKVTYETIGKQGEVEGEPHALVKNDYGKFDIFLNGDEDIESVFSHVLAVLPAPKVAVPDADALPPPRVFQIIRKPIGRLNAKPLKHLQLVETQTKGEDGVTALPSDFAAHSASISRWIIPAHGSVSFDVIFSSTEQGKFDTVLRFEVLGTRQMFPLPTIGFCEMPSIIGDSRNIFMRRIKSISPGAPPPSKRFVASDEFFSFGPLQIYKKPASRHDPTQQPPPSSQQEQVPSRTISRARSARDVQSASKVVSNPNCDIFRLTNSGKYKCTVELGLQSKEGQPLNFTCFYLETSSIDLEEGESKDLKVWAFPEAKQQYSAFLHLCVVNNPTPVSYELRCWGEEPVIDLSGPWDDAIASAKTAVASCTDKKELVALTNSLAEMTANLPVRFDRMLIGKTEFRYFEIKNTSQLPVEWQIELEELANSEFLTISPLFGTLVVGEVATITVAFSSEAPVVLSKKFTLRYSDNEGGLRSDPAEKRVLSKSLSVIAEAYKIVAVSLTSADEEQGGSDVDFGLVRVGDFVAQTMKMSNRGKYQIGFKFIITKSSMASLLQIQPENGIIEPGSDPAEIRFSFCSADGELLLKGNKDVRVQIFEPLTNEVVETFPVYLSAMVKYSRFRLQPSRGVSFGAVRFDAESQSKKVELKNEGPFEFSYIFLPSLTEVDELDVLEKPMYNFYGYDVPKARRVAELGENYLSKLEHRALNSTAPAVSNAGGANAKKGGGDKDKNKKAPIASATGSFKYNPLFFDPDGLVSVPQPANTSLAIGSFKINPRLGILQPGQSVMIDASFEPSGSDVKREKMRICISGIDPNDSAAGLLRSFDLNGESCVPSIVTEDVLSIFEEQEVVSSLATAFPAPKDKAAVDSVADASSRLENLAVGKVVYAEAERMLVFGPILCSGVNTRGVIERVKIINPTKINTKVQFMITPSGDSASASAAADSKASKGKDAKAAAKGKSESATMAKDDVFTVQPQSWDIPPHEYRYVSIHFNPREIKSYRVAFLAEVEGAQNNGLTFQLGGSGTLPCVAIERPVDRSSDGSILIAFGKVHLDKSSTKKLVLRNDGVMPCTCLFDTVGAEEFKFPYRGASLTLSPGARQEIDIAFAPKVVNDQAGHCKATIKMTVLHNQFDTYTFTLEGTAYACKAVIEIPSSSSTGGFTGQDTIVFPDINLANGEAAESVVAMIRSLCAETIKFDFSPDDDIAGFVSISPSMGHLGPGATRNIAVTFKASSRTKLDGSIKCVLKVIDYSTTIQSVGGTQAEDGGERNVDATDVDLWGLWDNSMKSIRPISVEDEATLATYEAALKEFNEKVVEVDKKKKQPTKVPPTKAVPPTCNLQRAPTQPDGTQMVFEIVQEPRNEILSSFVPQEVFVMCEGVADIAKYSFALAGQNVTIKPTFMFQSTVYGFDFTNESDISLPVSWSWENMKRSSSRQQRSVAALSTAIPCPFSLEPESDVVPPNSSKQFTLRFSPTECDDFVYMLQANTLSVLPVDPAMAAASSASRAVIQGSAKRPICHFDIVESTDYLARRPTNLKNEVGVVSPIESANLRVVEVESCGLKTRNTFRFYVTNPTSENYEFLWEPVGQPNPAWRCVQTAGMLFSGKRVEMTFEYIADDVAVAESFFMFTLPYAKIDQLFLFSGKVREPRVEFSSSRIDFHSVMLGGKAGLTETVYLENEDDLPFHFAFDKYSLAQLEGLGSSEPVLYIFPQSGVVAAHSKIAITMTFKPQEEVLYNYNIICEVKRKPKKLSINVKGEGYAVHAVIQLEQTDFDGPNGQVGATHLVTLRPTPAVNYADFGAVQILDTVVKKVSIMNTGKYNFDYSWNTDAMGPMLSLTGSRLGGTLQKGGALEYDVTFSPKREASLDGSLLALTVAGKYTYNIFARGSGVKPALRFSFLQYDFGPCFITSPGGTTVIEEIILRLVNSDPSNNISVESTFVKTRTLFVDVSPTVLEPGCVLEIPVRFAPRECKDYLFSVPFILNGISQVNVSINGQGILPRVELVNPSQYKTGFGIVDIGNDIQKSVAIVNKSKKAVAVQLVEDGPYNAVSLEQKGISYHPRTEFVMAPRETINLQIIFSPSRRIDQFSQDLSIRYAGITRTLLTVAGKAQGLQVHLDSDSLPFGTVCIDSQKTKKLSLENVGDIPITYQWDETSFGPHFCISPLVGKLLPKNEVSFDVVFRPKFVDGDIRTDNMTLLVPGSSPLHLSCSGRCISQPSDSVKTLDFSSLARKEQTKQIKVTNPTDKDWYLSPSLEGVDWLVPHEFKVPAKGSADLDIKYFPLSMTSTTDPAAVVAAPSSKAPAGRKAGAAQEPEVGTNITAVADEKNHVGKLFLALPDGTALLYNLTGRAGPPESSGELTLSVPAKKSGTVIAKLKNWLSDPQKFTLTHEFTKQHSPSTFIIATNAVDIGPNGTKEMPLKFISFVEGESSGKIRLTNPKTGEYISYTFSLQVTSPQFLETVSLEAPIRQSARAILTLENPLPSDAVIAMKNSHQNGTAWWTCDSPVVRVRELTSLTGHSEASFEVEYRPLALNKASSSLENTLSISTKELGDYKYKLTLKPLPPTLRPTLNFNVPLGASQSESFLIRAFNATDINFSCVVKRADVFAVPSTFGVKAVTGGWDGDDVRIPVTVEPMDIGVVRDVLTVTAPDGSEYVCDLVLSCTAPLPKGPFELNADGKAMEVAFRNCFAAASTWTFSVDSSAFRIVTPSLNVAAKSQGVCQVVFDPKAEHLRNANADTLTAKLFAKCSAKPDVPPWIFYLRGLIKK